MKNFFILTLSVFFVSALPHSLKASLILTADISQTDFNTAFNTERVWYTQIQPGGTGSTHPKNEFELGSDDDPYYEGNTSIIDKGNNPFVIDVSSSNFLSITLNSVGTPGGDNYGIPASFNTIWIGLKFNVDNGFSDETIDVTNHQFESSLTMAILPDISLDTEPGWSAFKFYIDGDSINIGEMTITGNIVPDMHFGGASNEEWTYTVFATQDPSIIPEPSTLALILSALSIAAIALRNRP